MDEQLLANDIENDIEKCQDKQICHICYEEEGIKIIRLLCKHELCFECLKKLPKKECPWCRSPLSYKKTPTKISTFSPSPSPRIETDQWDNSRVCYRITCAILICLVIGLNVYSMKQ